LYEGLKKETRTTTAQTCQIPCPQGFGEVNKSGEKAVFGLVEPIRFRLALFGMGLGRVFNKRFL
jgi:hypothetical protein